MAMAAIRARRERHGRIARGSLLAHLGAGRSLSFFETVVSQTVDFLRTAWPEELSKLDYRLKDAPDGSDPKSEVARYSVNQKTFRITIYRLPIERMTHHRRTDRMDERFHIEQFVFQAAAELIGKNPDDLIPDQFKR
ncbi:MAG: hypothetical protein RL197_443 [Actinomycetota bacterium]|jgi:hypothetical protein